APCGSKSPRSRARAHPRALRRVLQSPKLRAILYTWGSKFLNTQPVCPQRVRLMPAHRAQSMMFPVTSGPARGVKQHCLRVTHPLAVYAVTTYIAYRPDNGTTDAL